MTTKQMAALAALLPFLLTSTAMADVITKQDLHPAYTPEFVQLAASSGHFPVVLVNDPLADKALLKELSLPGYYQRAPLTETTAANAKGGHLVLAFRAPAASDGAKACQDPASVSTWASGLKLPLSINSIGATNSKARMSKPR